MLAAATACAALLLEVLLARLLRGVSGVDGTVSETVDHHARPPLRASLVLAGLYAIVPALRLPERAADVLAHVLLIGLIVAMAWFLIGLSTVGQAVVRRRFPTDITDNLRARRVQTKVQLLRRVVVGVVAFLAVAAILLTFPAVRGVGVTLFASAGIVGIVVGIAAQPTLSNLIAGLQVAVAEPIRIDDVVIVEGEWGWIEEIGLTYVVVRLWDQRRLVVPLSYFLQEPFENWTRRTAELLGTVFLHLDYRVPVDEVREELGRILEGSERWDGRVKNLQVVDADERAVRLRALMSAPDAPTAWELRCHVREQLIAYLQREHPESLPRVRAEVEREPEPSPFEDRNG